MSRPRPAAVILAVALWAATSGTGLAAGPALSRAVMAERLVAALHLPLGAPAPPYADVPARAPFAAAVAAGADAGLWGAWSPGARFSPQAPATLAAAVGAVVNRLGYGHVAAALGRPGLARVATALGLVAQGARLSGPLTAAALSALVARLPRGAPAGAQRLAARAASGVQWFAPAQVVAGSAAEIGAVAVDRAGYRVPVPVHLTVNAGALNQEDGVFTAPDRPGWVTVRATLPGSTLRASDRLQVVRLTGLAFAPRLPAAMVAARRLQVTAEVLSDGRPLASDNQRPITLTVVQGRRRRVLTVQDQAGVAPFTLGPLSPGTATVRLAAPALPARVDRLQVLGRPAPAWRVAGLPSRAEPGAVVRLTLRPGHALADGAPRPALDVTGPARLVRLLAMPEARPSAWRAVLSVGPGAGRVRVAITTPGGAVGGRRVAFTVAARRTLRASCAPDRVDAPLAVEVGLRGPGAAATRASLVLTGPDGGTAGPVTSPAGGGRVRVWGDPVVSGRYTVGVSAPGAVATTVRCAVRPGAAVALQVRLTPTSVLQVGQRAAVWAALVDRLGNPVRPPRSLTLSVTGPLGRAGGGGRTLAGGRVEATLVALRPGAARITARAPGMAPVTVRARVLAAPADLFAGKGLWLPYWVWDAVSDRTLLAQAQSAGVTAIYLEVATSADGFYGQPALFRFTAEAHADGIAVVPWVYADLVNPVQDSLNARQVTAYRTPDGTAPDGYAADVEANAALPAWALGPYLSALRRDLGSRPLLAVTYPPGGLAPPYALVARYATAIGPMDYWHGTLTDMSYAQAYDDVAASVRTIRRQAPHTPVAVLAQAFDMFTASGTGAYNPTAAEVAGAAAAARAAGAIGVSFYQWGTVSAAQWPVIRGAWGGP